MTSKISEAFPRGHKYALFIPSLLPTFPPTHQNLSPQLHYRAYLTYKMTKKEGTSGLNENEINTLVAAAKQISRLDYEKLGGDLGSNKKAAEKRWSRLKQKAFGQKKSEVDSGKSLALLESCGTLKFTSSEAPPIYITNSPLLPFLPYTPSQQHRLAQHFIYLKHYNGFSRFSSGPHAQAS
jgi:hypothetical protein